MRHFWREHNISVIVVAVLLAQTALCWWSGLAVYPADYYQTPTKPPYWLWFVDRYNLSVVADVYGALFLIHLSAHGREKGSPATGDDE